MEVLLTPRAWRGYRSAHLPAGSWTVEGDALRALAGGAQVSLISGQQFRDFDLSFEWRLAVGGNSGIMYRVHEDCEDPAQSGPEMQLLDNGNHPDGRAPETSCGALYGLQAPENTPQCPPGLFNIARIRMQGSRVEHWLNGARVLECDLASRDFRERVARSKYRDFPQFARAAEGHVVLQHHGADVWFRNVRIESL